MKQKEKKKKRKKKETLPFPPERRRLASAPTGHPLTCICLFVAPSLFGAGSDSIWFL
jgi:hypothetical protein